MADVFFLLRKPRLSNYSTGAYSVQGWFRSAVKENQVDLTWDVSSENLYINTQSTIWFSLADDDRNGNVDDRMLGPPFERPLYLVQYNLDQPNTITLSSP